MANISGWKSPSVVDRISLLPEALQCHILSFLSTQETVRTSVLSSTWRYLWKCVPRFELESCNIPNDEACVDFIDKFLNSQSDSCLCEFSLCIGSDNSNKDASLYEPCLGKLIKRKIQVFKVSCYRESGLIIYPVCLTLPVREALVSLHLFSVKLNDLGSLSLPCLKILYLRYVMFPEPLVLDTPRLEELLLVDFDLQFKKFKIISMSDSIKVEFDVSFVLYDFDLSERNIIYNLFNSFSDARDMTLSWNILEIIYSLVHMNPLPKFRYLTSLRATIYLNSSLEVLPMFLESCPNLKRLTLKLYEDEDLEGVATISNVLSYCLVSSLEYVEIKIRMIKEKTTLRKLVIYFLDNAKSLKKLVLRLKVSDGDKPQPQDVGFLKQFFDSERRSHLCQFEVLLLSTVATHHPL